MTIKTKGRGQPQRFARKSPKGTPNRADTEKAAMTIPVALPCLSEGKASPMMVWTMAVKSPPKIPAKILAKNKKTMVFDNAQRSVAIVKPA